MDRERGSDILLGTILILIGITGLAFVMLDQVQSAGDNFGVDTLSGVALRSMELLFLATGIGMSAAGIYIIKFGYGGSQINLY